MTTRQDPLVKRICDLVGAPDADPRLVRFLAMVVVAWADGRVQPGELEAIREAASAEKLKPKVRAYVEELLKSPPGPYLEHRVIMLIRLIQKGMNPEEREKYTGDLLRSAESVDRTAFGILRRLFDPDDQTTQGIRRIKRSLAEDLRPEIEAVLARLLVHRVKVTDRKKAGAMASPQLMSAMHLVHDSFAQIRALHFPAEKSHPAAVLCCLEQFQFGADLDEEVVARTFHQLAGRPEIERWVELYLATSSLARPANPAVIEHLKAKVWMQAEVPIHVVSLAEMSDLEDKLARNHGWAGWVSGTFREIVVDQSEVRRDVPPGNFACPRVRLRPPAVTRHRISNVQGLLFRVLTLESETGPRFAVATPEPEPGRPPTGEFIRWLCHFLPLIHDPLSTPLFGYEEAAPAPSEADATRWLMELRSGFPEDPSSLTPEALPPGRALVVTPWLWLRLAWAMGVDPDAA